MGSDELVKRLQKEAAMLREIAKSQARGVDWQANLTAAAEWFDRASAQLAEARESKRAAEDFDVIMPVGYGWMPEGTRCRCPKLWTDGNGRYACCKMG